MADNLYIQRSCIKNHKNSTNTFKNLVCASFHEVVRQVKNSLSEYSSKKTIPVELTEVHMEYMCKTRGTTAIDSEEGQSISCWTGRGWLHG